MEANLLEQTLDELPNLEHRASLPYVRDFARLVDSDLPLQSFLEQLLPQLCQLFAAQAAVAWMKTYGAAGAVFGVRYRMDHVLESVSEQKKHERLVQVAWQQRSPMLAEPAQRNDAVSRQLGSGEANPSSMTSGTGHLILFAPILHMGESIALLEVVLPKLSAPLTQPQRHLYLRSIQLVAERVYGGLRQRMAMPVANLPQAVDQLQQLSSDVELIQQQIRRTLDKRLQQFHGWAFASLAENQEFARQVHHLLDGHGLRVECPECRNPAILRCLRVGNAKNGAFVFDHYLDSGRTFHGGPTTVPLLKVVPKPARRAVNK
jgi:hypothetical protein